MSRPSVVNTNRLDYGTDHSQAPTRAQSPTNQYTRGAAQVFTENTEPWRNMVQGVEYDTDISQAPTRVPSPINQGPVPEQTIQPAPKRPKPVKPTPGPWIDLSYHDKEPTHPKEPKKYQYKHNVSPQIQPKSRMSAADYQATDIHGFFGLIDCGEDGRGCRLLKAHMTKRAPMSALDISAGESIPVLSTRVRGLRTSLRVQYVSRSQYYSPGAKVSTLNIGVSIQDWATLVSTG